MALTLIESSKLHSGNVFRQAVIEQFAMSSDILRVLPFVGISGNAYSYNLEQTLPGVGFRGINEAFSESTGIINPKTETLKITGGDLDVDNVIIKTQGEDVRTTHEAMKIKAITLNWNRVFVKGDSNVNPREFDGLQKRLGGNQLIENSAGTGSPLSLAKLDEAIDAVDGPTHLMMNKTMRRLLTAASRSTALGGFISYDKDDFGRQITQYNDLPILIVDEDNEGTQIMKFDEAALTGGTTSTSIYIVAFSDGKVEGIQNGDIEATDLGEQDDKPVHRTRVQWLAAIAVQAARSAARVRGITSATVTA